MPDFPDVLTPIAGIVGTALNYEAQQSANRTNLQIARDNRDFYYQQWQRENAYNDPSAQMERLARAGLNPNLMYGEGTGGLPASATMQNVDTGRVVAPQVDPLLLAQIANINADTDQKKAQTESTLTLLPFNVQNIKANNDKLAADVRKLDAEQQDIYVQWSFSAAKLAIDRDSADAQIKLWNEQAGLAEQDKLRTAEEYRQLQALFLLKKQGLELSNKQIMATIDCTNAQANTFRRQLALMDSMMELNYANADASLTNAQVNVHAEARNTALAPFEAEVRKQLANLQEKQAEYWEDYVETPWRYHPIGSDGSYIMSPRKTGRRVGRNIGRRIFGR